MGKIDKRATLNAAEQAAADPDVVAMVVCFVRRTGDGACETGWTVSPFPDDGARAGLAIALCGAGGLIANPTSAAPKN